MYSWWSKLTQVCILEYFDNLGVSTADLKNQLSQSSDRRWEGVRQTFWNAQLIFCSPNVRACSHPGPDKGHANSALVLPFGDMEGQAWVPSVAAFALYIGSFFTEPLSPGNGFQYTLYLCIRSFRKVPQGQSPHPVN